MFNLSNSFEGKFAHHRTKAWAEELPHRESPVTVRSNPTFASGTNARCSFSLRIGFSFVLVVSVAGNEFRRAMTSGFQNCSA